MLTDRVLFPIQALGPGERIVIWTVGCSKKCKNCSNEELWEFNKKKDVPATKLWEFLEEVIKTNNVQGVTFTGGDPLEQADDLLFLTEKLQGYCKDILVYTGYTLEEIEKSFPKEQLEKLKATVGVLIDGPYIDSQNRKDCCLRGSANQRIIYFNGDLKGKYEEYLKKGRQIQNVYLNNRAVSVGIHDKEEQYDRYLRNDSQMAKGN